MTDFDGGMDRFEKEREVSAETLKDAIGSDEAQPKDEVQRDIQDDVVSPLSQIIGSIQDATDPEEVFAVGLAALETVEQKRFITQNLLEAVKGGQSLPETLVRYNKLGLIDYGAEEDVQRYEGAEDSAAMPGRFLNGVLKMLKKFAAQMISLICKAVAYTDRFAGLSPVVGFVGTFPNLSFQLQPNVENLAEALGQLTVHL